MDTANPMKISNSGFFNQAIWLVGFRPFFFLAFIAGAILPLLWGFSYVGLVNLSQAKISPLQWHAHEMLFGFGWAVLGGFLLTASKNWLHIRGLHGGPLALVVAFWLLERFSFFVLPAETPAIVRFLVWNASVLSIGGYVIYCLLRYRKQDTFPDNYFFILALPLLIVSKELLLNPETYQHGWAMSLGVFRLAFAVMFERTMTQFMKNAEGVTLFRRPWLDLPIKFFVLASIFASFMPAFLATLVLGLAGLLLLIRFFLWSPMKGFRRFEIGIMYVGYLALGMHLLFSALNLSGLSWALGSWAVHVFTFLCMGVVIPGMMVRISQGHTGRKLVFTKTDKIAISAMFVAAFFRLAMTQFLPDQYPTWIAVSGLGWTLCFVLIGFRLTPFLFQPRIDGKIH